MLSELKSRWTLLKAALFGPKMLVWKSSLFPDVQGRSVIFSGGVAWRYRNGRWQPRDARETYIIDVRQP